MNLKAIALLIFISLAFLSGCAHQDPNGSVSPSENTIASGAETAHAQSEEPDTAQAPTASCLTEVDWTPELLNLSIVSCHSLDDQFDIKILVNVGANGEMTSLEVNEGKSSANDSVLSCITSELKSHQWMPCEGPSVIPYRFADCKTYPGQSMHCRMLSEGND